MEGGANPRVSHSTRSFLLFIMKDYAAEAFASLNSDDKAFLKALPKAELHAHLNGCIPLSCLQDLVRQRPVQTSGTTDADEKIAKGLAMLEQGVVLEEIHEFFDLFPAIYALTSTPAALRQATAAVLTQFLQPQGDSGEQEPAQCIYLELRTTPRENAEMSREQYLDAVLCEMETYSADKCALIVSTDRRMDTTTMMECVSIAAKLKKAGRRVVGIDLCGTPTIGNAEDFLPAFKLAEESGLKLTVHIAETTANTEQDVMTLLSANPSRLGHATFLHKEARELVLEKKMAIEICLSSNLLCKTVDDLKAHHINYWLEHGLPLAICTDDTLVFRNDLVGEYALLMAAPPLGLGLSRDKVSLLAKMSLDVRFEQ